MAKKKPPAVPTRKKPKDLSLEEWQRTLRRQYVSEEKPKFIIKYIEGEHPVFGDYSVENPESGGIYKVALRSKKPGPNFCTCLDLKTNLLGTCKHIEAILSHIALNKKLATLLNDAYTPAYSSVYVKYGADRQVMLRIGERHEEQYQELARGYFDDLMRLRPEAFARIDTFLKKADRINSEFRCYPDAMDLILNQRERQARVAFAATKLTDDDLDELLKAPLFHYQKEGIRFAVQAGRCLLADDMGLGKTIQAIGSSEVLRKEFGVASILIICPTSLKYQWKHEIKKFSNGSTQVIEGDAQHRKQQYRQDETYKIISYNVAGIDLAELQKLDFDMIILDEAQRIKNWQTKTAKSIKMLHSTYAIVLTGTPIENKLEELYSIIQFVDPYKLGPLYKFLADHQVEDEAGKVVGYKELNQIHKLLSDTVLRRTKQDVLSQLPERSDKHLFVPLTDEQASKHEAFGETVAKLVYKWRRMGYLDEKDRQRLLSALNCMRMVADSTFILDQETRFDTKIDELMEILEDLLNSGDNGKAVIFSQWERMTRLVKQELEQRRVGFAYLHGGVPSEKRSPLLDRFREDPACRIFLSTDAGGVGLNLQSASLVVNLDIPWNPAVLEQRIGRVHRHGQQRNVRVINMVSIGSIEQRLLDVLQFKSSLFAGVLDNGSDQIFMGESRFSRFMQSVEAVTAATPPRKSESGSTGPGLEPQQETDTVGQFLHAAGNFLDTLSNTLSDPKAVKQLASSLVERDPVDGRNYLKIPVENEQTIATGLQVLSGLLAQLK